MYIKRNISWNIIFKYAWRNVIFFTLWAAFIFSLYYFLNWRFLDLPFEILSFYSSAGYAEKKLSRPETSGRPINNLSCNTEIKLGYSVGCSRRWSNFTIYFPGIFVSSSFTRFSSKRTQQ